jgi:hypothetical protein
MLRPDSPIGRLWNFRRLSLRLDVGRPDHLPPLLGFVGDQLAKVGGRAGEQHAQIIEPRLCLWIGEARVDLLVEPVDDLDRRSLWCANAELGNRLIPRHELAHGRDVR